MQLNVKDTVDQETYDQVVKLLIDYNIIKTKAHKNEINKPIEIIARDKANQIIVVFMGVPFGEP